jgi:hypothetical protein
MAAIFPPLSIYGDSRKMKLPLLHNTRIHALEGQFGNSCRTTIGRMPDDRTRLASTQALWSRRVSSASKRLGALESRLRCRASGLGFVAQPCNPTVLWWTAANPACRLQSWAATLHRLLSTTSSCFSCHNAARTWPRWPPGPSSQAYLSLH